MIAAVNANRPRLMPPSHRAFVVGDTSKRGDSHQHGVDAERVEDHPIHRDPEHDGPSSGFCAAASICHPGVGAAQEQLERRGSRRCATTRIPTSSAEMAMPPARHTSVPNDRRELLRRGPELDPQVLADDEAEPDGGDDERDVVAARLQQAVDERHLEHIAEQQDRDAGS